MSSGKVTDIKVLEQTEKKTPEFTEELFGRVIQAQSLQVDTISGATLTSKAFLKGVEGALEGKVK
ncbi:Electron transport complex subunit RsxG [compost metagenome]